MKSTVVQRLLWGLRLLRLDTDKGIGEIDLLSDQLLR